MGVLCVMCLCTCDRALGVAAARGARQDDDRGAVRGGAAVLPGPRHAGGGDGPRAHLLLLPGGQSAQQAAVSAAS